ncbi:MAG: zinc ribbon domain-containing protein [Blastocatellia bacterium]|nr:zinc ribbon domain-containing protein [Blastocatellia bacterium]
MRKFLSIILLSLLLLGCWYLILVRQNRATSYKNSLAAFDQAKQFWPKIANEVQALRSHIGEESSISTDNQYFVNALNLIVMKRKEKIALRSGVKALVYAEVSYTPNSKRRVSVPGQTYLSNPNQLWLPTNVEVVVASQDILISEIKSTKTKSTLGLDPFQREADISSQPGEISLTLFVSAPGEYEQYLTWIGNVILILCYLLLLLVPTYVWQDSQGRYSKALLWTSLAATANIFGLLAYLLFGRVPVYRCSECNQAVNEIQKYCPYCRTSLKSECVNCGQALDRNWKYCSSCGVSKKNL